MHFLAGASLASWMQTLYHTGDLDLAYWPRAALITLSCLATLPLRGYETLAFGERIAQHTITCPPVFILGHWRSGTTHLHYLMGQDPQLGYVSLLQSAFPHVFLGSGKVIARWLHRFVPTHRPMDNMQLAFTVPFEEEMALGNMDRHSYYHCLCFPRRLKPIFRASVLFEGAAEAAVERWKTLYLTFLKKVSLSAGGKRLVLKNPPHTARLRALLDLFPEARFIHVYRNPYVVYASMEHLFRQVLPMVALQRPNDREREEHILFLYEQLMRQYVAESPRIPAGQLAEIRFEELEAHPLAELRRVYTHLGLDGFEVAEPVWRDYLARQKTYQKNAYSLRRDTIDTIYRRWHFTIDQWHYEVPPDLLAPA